MNKTLIAYFSYQGHTRQLAQHIQKATDGTLFEIKPAQAYPDDYDTCEASQKGNPRRVSAGTGGKMRHRTVQYDFARHAQLVQYDGSACRRLSGCP